MAMPLPHLTRHVVLAIVVFGLLYALLFYSPPQGGLWTQVFINSLHVPVFGLIAASVYVLWRPERSWTRRAGTALIAACALGLLSELAQTVTSRDASFEDFIADCLGAAGFLGVAVAVLASRELSRARRAASALLGMAMLGWALAPLALVTAAYIERDATFPVIFDPDSTFGRKLARPQNIRYEIVRPPGTEGAHARITFLDAPWPGLSLHDLAPDWTAYTTLVVDVAIGEDIALELNLRVHDEAHRHNQVFNDRFSRSFNLGPGQHSLRIPLADLRDAPRGRDMDLSRISELIIFGTRAEAGRSIRLYRIRLE